jgi:hypothetical protein
LKRRDVRPGKYKRRLIHDLEDASKKTKCKKDDVISSILKERKGSGFLTAFGSEFSADEC